MPLQRGPGLYIVSVLEPWAARYKTWLLIKLTPKGEVFSFLFLVSWSKCNHIWESHSISTDIAGCIALFTTTIMSRVPSLNWRTSEPALRLSALLHHWQICCCKISNIASCAGCCSPPQMVASTTLWGPMTSPWAISALLEGACC